MINSVRLKRKEDQRIRDGHLWVFSNEIQEITGNPEGGSTIDVLDAGGRYLGSGIYNPKSLIAVRLFSFDESTRGTVALCKQLFLDRFAAADHLRSQLFPGATAYRLIHGEADLLPGLIIDRYNEYFSVQTVSLGMDAHLQDIADALEELFQPKGIVERNDSSLRELEGLEQRSGIVRGTVSPVVIEEDGIRYNVNILEGQKTGFFLDQRVNRSVIEDFSSGKSVLDCFCNDGGFALHAARAGASAITAVDVSRPALARAEANAKLNECPTPIDWVEGDVFQFLEESVASGAQYDLVILDPPSFTRSRKNVPAAKQGYRQLHAKAFSLLNRGGILATASCSHHIFEDTFLETIQTGAQSAGKRIAMLDWRGASPDHPVLPAMPETRYLKFGVFCVL